MTTSTPARLVPVRVSALLLVLALIATGCGGGSLSDGPGRADPAEADAGDRSADGDRGGPTHGGGGGVAPDGDPASWADGQSNLVTPAPGEVTFDVTYSDETVMVEPAAVRDSGGDHTYVLDAAAAGDVEPGSVLLIPGIALRRVTGVERDGGQVRLTTEFAALTDAVVDGDISWDVELGALADFVTDPDSTPPPFVFEEAAGAVMPSEAVATLVDGTTRLVSWTQTAQADWPLRWTYSQDGLDYLFGLAPGPDHSEVLIQVTRGVGGETSMVYQVSGRVETPRATGSVSIRNGSLNGADIGQEGLRGQLSMNVAVAGGGDKIPFEFTLPGIWFKYVIPVGPVPVTIAVDARVVGNLDVPAGASARAEAEFAFGGGAGFRYTGSSVDASVRMPDFGIDPELVDAAGWFGNFVDAQYGVAFPRMSVSIFDQGVVPVIYTGMIARSRLEWGPVCKTGELELVMRARYDFKILGVNLLSSDEIDLVEPRHIRGEGDGCQ